MCCQRHGAGFVSSIQLGDESGEATKLWSDTKYADNLLCMRCSWSDDN